MLFFNHLLIERFTSSRRARRKPGFSWIIKYNGYIVSYFTYVLRSEFSGKIYIGQTDNLELRLRRHNGTLPDHKRGFTRINKGPWKVVYQEMFSTRREAIKREKYLKSHRGRDWLRSSIKK